ncbi:PREDICTED: uncharacterized protein LOC102100796 [Pseudopodoces humilis]|uniref:uncharacterized protein LOC102100796 n=1 Tax=Pseudopodoces humilis TaxID=181119 RepID=UPI0006B71DC7|nr:PREDICTED: uncharacterized protein LOC102100796 [Pseudopodoces humilis]
MATLAHPGVAPMGTARVASREPREPGERDLALPPAPLSRIPPCEGMSALQCREQPVAIPRERQSRLRCARNSSQDNMERFSLSELGLPTENKAIQGILCPMAVELCHLLLALEREDGICPAFPNLGEKARELAKAMEELAAVARRISEDCGAGGSTELCPAGESLLRAGRDVALAAFQLQKHPHSPGHRQQLAAAAKRSLTETAKILQLEEAAGLRRIAGAASWLLESLSELRDAQDAPGLLDAFQAFSEALLRLSRLTAQRLQLLGDCPRGKSLAQSLQLLHQCVPLIHTALPRSRDRQADLSQDSVFQLTESTVRGLLSQLTEPQDRSGIFSQQVSRLQALLSQPDALRLSEGGFSSLLEAVILHGMLLAESSRLDLRLELLEQPGGILRKLQPLTAAFFAQAQRMLRAADLVLAGCAEAQTAREIREGAEQLRSLLGSLPSLLTETSGNATEQLQALGRAWARATDGLLRCFEETVGVRELLELSILELAEHKERCEAALERRDPEGFSRHAARLTGWARWVVGAASRHVDRATDPIFRNGLLVWVEQLAKSILELRAVTALIPGRFSCLQSRDAFSQAASSLMDSALRVQAGLDGSNHPEILSPLRERVRSTEVEEGLELRSHTGIRTRTAEAAFQGDLQSHPSSPPANFRLDPREGETHPVIVALLAASRAGARDAVRAACSVLLELSDGCVEAAREALPVAEPPQLQVLQQHRDIAALTPRIISLATKMAPGQLPAPGRLLQMALRLSGRIRETLECLAAVAGLWNALAQQVLGFILAGDFPRGKQALDETLLGLAGAVQVAGAMASIACGQENPNPSRGQQSFLQLQAKFSRAQLNTKAFLEKAASFRESCGMEKAVLELRGVRWAVGMRVLLDAMDGFVGRDVLFLAELSRAVRNKAAPRSLLPAVAENSLRLQEAARLSYLSCPGDHGAREILALREEIQVLMEALLDVSNTLLLSPLPTASLAIRFELLRRDVALRAKALSLHMERVNMEQLQLIQDVAGAALSNLSQEERERSKEGFEEKANRLMADVQWVRNTLRDALEAGAQLGSQADLLSVADHLLLLTADLVESVQQHFRSQQDTGDPLLDTGDPRQDTGDPCQDTGDPLLDTGDPCLDTGDPRQDTGDPLLDIGDPHLDTGDPRLDTGDPLLDMGDPCLDTGDPLLDMGDPCLDTGDPCLDTGDPRLDTGDPRLDTGDPRLDTGDPRLDSAVWYWSAKAHYLVTQLRVIPGINRDVLRRLTECLQREHFPGSPKGTAALSPAPEPTPEAAGIHPRGSRGASGAGREAGEPHQDGPSSIPPAKQETGNHGKWQGGPSKVSQVTQDMATRMLHMAQFLRRKGPIASKEQFVACARRMVSDGQVVVRFGNILAKHCLDQRCSTELLRAAEHTQSIGSQLAIVARVKAVTGESRASSELLLSNVQNLIQAAQHVLRAAEAACVKGLGQPSADPEEEEVAAFCQQWRKNLTQHRAKEALNSDRDELGLRKTRGAKAEPTLMSLVQEQPPWSRNVPKHPSPRKGHTVMDRHL